MKLWIRREAEASTAPGGPQRRRGEPVLACTVRPVHSSFWHALGPAVAPPTMRFFGLTVDDSASGGPGAVARPPGLASSMLYGSLSFGAVSVMAYSIWACRLIEGTAAMYSATAAVYVGLSGLVLSRLVAAPGAWKRFPFLLATGFVAY